MKDLKIIKRSGDGILEAEFMGVKIEWNGCEFHPSKYEYCWDSYDGAPDADSQCYGHTDTVKEACEEINDFFLRYPENY